MKKVTFLVLHLGYGGIETSTINTANALCDKYDVNVVSFYKLKYNQSNVLHKSINVRYLYDGEPNRNEFKDALKKINILGIFKEGFKSIDILIKKRYLVKKEIQKTNSDIIISTRYDFSTLLSKYGKRDITKIAQEHHHHNNNKKYINILKKHYNNIDYLCALTKNLKRDYKIFLKNNKHTKVVLLPNMLVDKVTHTSNLKSKNLISIGRLHEGKRIDELINIFSKIENKNCKLYIIGDGDEKTKLEHLVYEKELNDRVIMTGYLNKNEQKKYLLDSCVFVMTSISEGLPMVLLEAMQYGLPCIAYETESGVRDIINNHKNGYIIKNRDEFRYVNCLNKILSDTDLLHSLSKNATNTANAFDKENILKIWFKILK